MILYRAYDVEGDLLYVGVARDFHKRLLTHRQDSLWYPRADRWVLEEYDTRAEVLDAEVRAIRSEEPRFNIQYNLQERS